MRVDVPADLLVAIVIMVAMALGTFVLVLRALRDAAHRPRVLTAAAGATYLLVHAFYLNGHPIITRIIPSANVIVWGNGSVIAVAVLAAATWRTMPGPMWQRRLVVGVLGALSLWRAYSPIFGEPPVLGPDRWHDGVCRQSSTSTCSAAAAATLLRTAGISTSEAETVRLGLTHSDGTTFLGIYRAVKLKCNGTELVVRADRLTLREVRARRLVPSIGSIGLASLNGNAPNLAPGNSHSIVLLGFDEAGAARIADPFSGNQTWDFTELERVWQRDVIALVKRN